MNDLTDLQSLYEHLESEAYAYEYASLIVQDFQKLGKLAEANQDLVTSKKCKWEAAFFDFNLDGNELVAQRIYQDEQGKSYSYPDPNMLDAEVLDYVDRRLEQTNHPLLSSRYASILWCSSRKHNKYAEVAISSNLQIVDRYLNNQTDPVRCGNLVGYILKSTLNMAKVVYKRDENKQRVVTAVVLDAFRRLDNGAGGYKIGLLELVSENVRLFSNAQINEFLTHAKNLYKFFSKKNPYSAIDVLRICSKIEEKTGCGTENWILLIAKTYEQLMAQKEKKGDPSASHFCELAITYYGLAKNPAKARELEVKYPELRNNISIFEVKAKVDLSGYYKQIKEMSDEITYLSTDEIIEFLMDSDILFPYPDEARIIAGNALQNSVAFNLVTTQVINRLGNPVEIPSTEEEILNYMTHVQYSHMLKMFKWPLINMIFAKAHKKGKFTGDALIDYLKRKTWLGKEITRNSPNGPVTYCWLEMISPAIRLYLGDMPGIRKEDVVLSLDSLVLKIEGIVRDLCRLKQIPITVFENVKNGIIAHERDINALLFDPEISRIIEQNDLFFFRFILIEQTGANLRNDVAHALLPYDHYSSDFLNLLLLIIIRLAKIKVETVQSGGNTGEST